MVVLETAGLCLAAEYLLDLYPAVRFLLEAWPESAETGNDYLNMRNTDHPGDILLSARRADFVRHPDLYRCGCAVVDSAFWTAGEDPGAGGTLWQRVSLFLNSKYQQRLSGL